MFATAAKSLGNTKALHPSLARRGRIVTTMQLPPFTVKSAMLYLLGVVAILLAVYFLVNTVTHLAPHQKPQPSTSAVAAFH